MLVRHYFILNIQDKIKDYRYIQNMVLYSRLEPLARKRYITCMKFIIRHARNCISVNLYAVIVFTFIYYLVHKVGAAPEAQ